MNQAKWISDINPSKEGNYLIRVKVKPISGYDSKYYYHRLDFRQYGNYYKWIYKDGVIAFSSWDLANRLIELEWWDEYNYFGEIRNFNLKFPNEKK